MKHPSQIPFVVEFPSQIPFVVSFVAAVLSDLILFFALQIELVSRFLCNMAVGFMIVHCRVTNKDTCQGRLLKELGIVGNTAQRHSFYTHRKWAEVTGV